MRVLLLGFNGNVSTSLTSHLNSKGFDIVPFIRDEELKKNTINNHKIKQQILDSKAELIINCANLYQGDYKELLFCNYEYPYSILKCCENTNIKQFINISTALPENVSDYSFTKRKLEKEINIEQLNKMDVNFLELNCHIIYGPKLKSNIINHIANELKLNNDLELTECLQRRDMIHIQDLFKVIERLIFFEERKKTVEVGSGINIPLRDIIVFMKNELKSSSKINFGAVEYRANEPMKCIADNSFLRELGCTFLSWQEGVTQFLKEEFI